MPASNKSKMEADGRVQAQSGSTLHNWGIVSTKPGASTKLSSKASSSSTSKAASATSSKLSKTTASSSTVNPSKPVVFPTVYHIISDDDDETVPNSTRQNEKRSLPAPELIVETAYDQNEEMPLYQTRTNPTRRPLTIYSDDEDDPQQTIKKPKIAHDDAKFPVRSFSKGKTPIIYNLSDDEKENEPVMNPRNKRAAMTSDARYNIRSTGKSKEICVKDKSAQSDITLHEADLAQMDLDSYSIVDQDHTVTAGHSVLLNNRIYMIPEGMIDVDGLDEFVANVGSGTTGKQLEHLLGIGSSRIAAPVKASAEISTPIAPESPTPISATATRKLYTTIEPFITEKNSGGVASKKKGKDKDAPRRQVTHLPFPEIGPNPVAVPPAMVASWTQNKIFASPVSYNRLLRLKHGRGRKYFRVMEKIRAGGLSNAEILGLVTELSKELNLAIGTYGVYCRITLGPLSFLRESLTRVPPHRKNFLRSVLDNIVVSDRNNRKDGRSMGPNDSAAVFYPGIGVVEKREAEDASPCNMNGEKASAHASFRWGLIKTSHAKITHAVSLAPIPETDEEDEEDVEQTDEGQGEFEETDGEIDVEVSSDDEAADDEEAVGAVELDDDAQSEDGIQQAKSDGGERKPEVGGEDDEAGHVHVCEQEGRRTQFETQNKLKSQYDGLWFNDQLRLLSFDEPDELVELGDRDFAELTAIDVLKPLSTNVAHIGHLFYPMVHHNLQNAFLESTSSIRIKCLVVGKNPMLDVTEDPLRARIRSCQEQTRAKCLELEYYGCLADPTQKAMSSDDFTNLRNVIRSGDHRAVISLGRFATDAIAAVTGIPKWPHTAARRERYPHAKAILHENVIFSHTYALIRGGCPLLNNDAAVVDSFCVALIDVAHNILPDTIAPGVVDAVPSLRLQFAHNQKFPNRGQRKLGDVCSTRKYNVDWVLNSLRPSRRNDGNYFRIDKDTILRRGTQKSPSLLNFVFAWLEEGEVYERCFFGGNGRGVVVNAVLDDDTVKPLYEVSWRRIVSYASYGLLLCKGKEEHLLPDQVFPRVVPIEDLLQSSESGYQETTLGGAIGILKINLYNVIRETYVFHEQSPPAGFNELSKTASVSVRLPEDWEERYGRRLIYRFLVNATGHFVIYLHCGTLLETGGRVFTSAPCTQAPGDAFRILKDVLVAAGKLEEGKKDGGAREAQAKVDLFARKK